MVNFAVVLPPGIVTVFGNVAANKLLTKAITTPPRGAGEPSLTVPILSLPPLIDSGFSVKEVNMGGVTITEVVGEIPPKVAVMVTLV